MALEEVKELNHASMNLVPSLALYERDVEMAKIRHKALKDYVTELNRQEGDLVFFDEDSPEPHVPPESEGIIPAEVAN